MSTPSVRPLKNPPPARVRWAVLVACLLVLGYVTKFSEQYSRRVVLTWAALTPAVLVVVATAFHEIMRRLLCIPMNARKTVFAGFNEISRGVPLMSRTLLMGRLRELGC